MDPEGILVSQKMDCVMKMGEIEKEYCKGFELALYEMQEGERSYIYITP